MADMQSITVDADNLESNELQSETDKLPKAPDVKSMSVDIDNLIPNGFVVKINELRNLLQVRTVLDRPVLTPVIPDSNPNLPNLLKFLDIKLTSTQTLVTLRLRRDTLYLLGYQAKSGKWFELGDKHLIDKDTWLLKIGENYTDLLRAAGLEVTAGLTALGPPGYYRLQDAAHWLAGETYPPRNTPNDVVKRAMSLLMLIVMFCETARSIPTLTYLEGKFWDNLGDDASKIPAGVDKLAHIWGSSSLLVIKNAANPELKLSDKDKVDLWIEKQHITAGTIRELSRIFGILQDYPQK